MADLHVPIRAGTDIAFLGGIVNYIFEHDAWFEEYVRHYTNGPVIINEEFRTPRTRAGFFSGWNPEHSAYALDTLGLRQGRRARPPRASPSSRPTSRASRRTARTG